MQLTITQTLSEQSKIAVAHTREKPQQYGQHCGYRLVATMATMRAEKRPRAHTATVCFFCLLQTRLPAFKPIRATHQLLFTHHLADDVERMADADRRLVFHHPDITLHDTCHPSTIDKPAP